MRIHLVLNNGTAEDVRVMKNILRTHDIRVENIENLPKNNEMGAEIIPVLVLILPEISQFLQTILPAIQTYMEIRKPSGTKHDMDLINGDKRIHITNEDGGLNDLDKIAEFCNKTNFFS